MKFHSISSRSAIELLSFLTALTYAVSGNMETVLPTAAAVLAFLPISGEKTRISTRFALVSSLALCLPLSAGIGPGLPVVFSLILLYSFNALRIAMQYRHPRNLFSRQHVITVIENNSRMMYSFLLSVFDCILLCFFDLRPVMYLMEVLILCLCAFFLVCNHKGRIMFVSPDRERQVRDLVKGNLKTSVPEGELPAEVANMSRMYDKILTIMEYDKPYLDEYYSLADMASSVFSNRAYLSKTINTFSGKNFRQFINCYRVNYSVELVKKNPGLKVSELSSLSGFHSVVTFNLAFKLNMGETPTDYIRREKLKNLRDLSTYEGRERSTQQELS